MKLLFKQRFFSWFDSYDIFDERQKTVYTVKGQLSWGHCLKIFDSYGREAGIVQERVMTLLPKFEIYIDDRYVGCISRKWSVLNPKYDIDFNGWHVEGDCFGWDYTVTDSTGRTVAGVSKEIFNLVDTYVIDVADPKDALCALMLVLAIDAEKCSKNG